MGYVGVVVDELLDLVEHDRGTRQRAVLSQGATDVGQHFIDADVVVFLKVLSTQGRTDIFDATKVRVSGEVGFLKCGRGIEAAEFAGGVFSSRRNMVTNRVQLAIVAQVHGETGQRGLFREPHGLKYDAQDPKTNAAGPGFEGAASTVQADALLAAGTEFPEQFGDLRGQAGQASRRGTIRKGKIRPEIAEYLDQVGLAAAIEAANPDRLLFLTQVVQVRLEHLGQATLILPLADEGFQFVA